MNWIGRGTRGEFIATLTPQEVETLYDALDALTDRLESWKKEPDPQDDFDTIKLDQDLHKAERLFKAFDPLVKEARKDNS